MRDAVKRSSGFAEKRIVILFIMPTIITLGLVLFFPLLYSLTISFYRWSVARPFLGKTFVFFQNYSKALTDPAFLVAIRNTFVFTFFAVAVELILGIAVALLLQGNFKGKTFFQTALFLPVVTTPVAVGIIWRILFLTDVGLIPYLFQLAGFERVTFLSSPVLAMVAVIFVDIWQTTPFAFTLILAGLSSLPSEPYEAALIDGATSSQRFFYVTLPLLKPVIVVVLLIRVMDAFRVFDTIYILTGGGPGSATESVSTFTVRTAFQYFNTGYASALAYVVFIIIAVMSYLMIKGFKIEASEL
ncbi:MAG: sugar ABC transporter permease [Firmicutes bacterium]|nr:sugar ABC transporter permease [Bacillota bacterium]